MTFPYEKRIQVQLDPKRTIQVVVKHNAGQELGCHCMTIHDCIIRIDYENAGTVIVYNELKKANKNLVYSPNIDLVQEYVDKIEDAAYAYLMGTIGGLPFCVMSDRVHKATHEGVLGSTTGFVRYLQNNGWGVISSPLAVNPNHDMGLGSKCVQAWIVLNPMQKTRMAMGTQFVSNIEDWPGIPDFEKRYIHPPYGGWRGVKDFFTKGFKYLNSARCLQPLPAAKAEEPVPKSEPLNWAILDTPVAQTVIAGLAQREAAIANALERAAEEYLVAKPARKRAGVAK